MSAVAKQSRQPLRLALGLITVALLGVVAVLGLFVTKPDVVQDDYMRLIYIHPAVAWVAYLAFGITALASLLYLWKRTRSRFWDLLAGASAEVGVVFCAIALITGSIWGRPTWGTWWTWDARLTSTAVMFAMELGYLALRRVPGDVTKRSQRSAIAGLVAAMNVPIVHMSVEWWRTLHQGRTLLRPNPEIEGLQLTTMLLSIVAFTLAYAWLCAQRLNLEQLEEEYEHVTLRREIDLRQNANTRALDLTDQKAELS